MKVKSDRRELLDALLLAQTVVPIKSPQPILQNVKLVAENDVLEVLATDWEVSLRFKIERVEITEPGQALVPTRQLTDILRKLPDESVEFKVVDKTLTIAKENDYFKIQGEDPEEYPEIPGFREEGVVEVEPKVFSEMIRKTVFSASKEKMRYAINGVFFNISGNNFTMVATDGKRLAKIDRRIKGKKSVKVDAIVPTKGITLLEKMLAEEEEPVMLAITDRQCMAKTRKAVLASRLVEGQFPNYETVIPKETTKEITLSTAGFMSVVDQVSTFTSSESMTVKLSFSENKLVLSSFAQDLGEAKVQHSIEYSGEPIEIGFNPVFIKDVLSVVGTDKIVLKLKESTSPGVITSGDDYVYVIMPVNIV